MRTRLFPALSALGGPRGPRVLRRAPEGQRYRAGRELVGRDAPTYRPSTGTFSVTVSRLRATLPTRERGRR